MEAVSYQEAAVLIGTTPRESFLRRSWYHVHDHIIPHARNNYHPHLFGHRAIGLFSALLVTVKICTIFLMSFGPVLPALSSAITEQNIIALTNQSRTDYQLKALTQNAVLDKAAQAKADDMLAKGYFSHNTPDGKTPWDFIQSAGYNYISAGENLAVNFTEAENVEQAWMNSPGHKANILNKNFEEIGIGISQGIYQNHEAVFVVQMFGTPVAQKITLNDQPTQVQQNILPSPKTETQPSTVQNQVAGTQTEKLVIQDSNITLSHDSVTISAQVSSSAVKVIAYFGKEAVMMSPKEGKVWQGEVALANLTKEDQTNILVKAYDINNNAVQVQVASFAGSTPASFNVVNNPPAATVSAWGKVFDPRSVSDRFYLLFMAGMLTSLLVAIAVKRHVQHLSLVANGSFVVMLAAMLWMVG